MTSEWARLIRIASNDFLGPEDSAIEIVERKGLGHPDTLAELLADEFIRRYATYTIGTLGAIPNVSVDKVMLIGSLARLCPGSFTIERKARAQLIGKITRRVGHVEIPIEDLFREAVWRVFGEAGLSGLVDFMSLEVVNNDRMTDDHVREMYRPPSVQEIRPADPATWESADTASVTIEGPLTLVERLVIDLERELTGPFRTVNPEFGTDVKILAVRHDEAVDVTLCVPVRAGDIATRRCYLDSVDKAWQAVIRTSEPYEPQFKMTFHVNTKDVAGCAYLTAFGSSLDKGDQGTVGRGNGPLGVSSAGRWTIAEAIAGKNPFHHPAKVYAEIARSAIAKISDHGPTRISVTSRNGDRLISPASVIAQLAPGHADPAAIQAAITHCGDELLDRLDELSTELALRDPVAEFRGVGSGARQSVLATAR